MRQERVITVEEIKISDSQKEAVRGITVEYPYVLHYSDISRNPIPWHWHEEVEFGYVLSGKLEILTTEKKYIFTKDQGYFMNTNVLSSMRATEEGTEIHTHLFHPVFLSGHFHSIFETKYINPVIHNRNLEIVQLKGESKNQADILKMLCQAYQIQKREETEFETRNLFSEIWMLLLKEIECQPVQTVNLKNQERIQTMLSFIHQNYRDKISLEEIAASAAVSTRECIRCFQATIKKPPIEYLMDYRIDMAGKLLKKTDLSVTEITYQTGFSSSSYFGKIFRKKTGMTPAKYRNT